MNNSSVSIADNPLWELKFEYKNIPIIGDNINSKFPFRYPLKSAGIAIDSIRCAKLALNRGLGGVILEPAAYFYEITHSIYNEEMPDYGSRNRRMTLA